MLKNHSLSFLFLLFLLSFILAPQSIVSIFNETGCQADSTTDTGYGYCRINAGHQWLIYQCSYYIRLVTNKGNGNIDFFVPMKTCTNYVDYLINSSLPTDFVAGAPIILNSASEVSCNARCAEVGGSCNSIGTDSAATNNKYKSYWDQYGYATCPNLSGSSSTVMTKENRTCNNSSGVPIGTLWTYCLCRAPN